MQKNIEESRAAKFSWINITKNGGKELEYLRRKFGFHELDLKDCLPPLQRPKLVARPNYLFMILLFPVFDRKTGVLRASEIDFFITPKTLITVNPKELAPLQEIFTKCRVKKNKCLNAADLLHEILHELLLSCFPMLVHISNDIDNVENQLRSEFEKGTITEILRIKTNIVNFRKAMQPHKQVIRSLIAESPKFFPTQKIKIYFENLVSYTKEIWDLLNNYKDTIDALHETNVSLIDFRINVIMKTLTIFSVIVFPLTLLAAIFGMNTLGGMPLTNHPYGFWIILGGMMFGALGFLWFFERKKWL
ncbi:magnesium transporter CorA family protein [Patescibacteria group bacterium]|nr:magnesium transporter CorA family protein [Patescibacteria group bacterium]